VLRNIQNIKKYWLDFVKNNELHEELESIIKESWLRSKEYNINFYKEDIKKASKIELSKKLKENEDLINIAHPIMENLYNIVTGSGFVIILTDKEGCIIDIIGDEEMMKIEDLNLEIGTVWSEGSIGTNAIGTALYLDKPIQIIGAQHYYLKNHCLTCSTATIHNEKGQIIGCINMSGNYSKAHSHTTGVVVSGAYSIEKQFSLIESNRLLNVIFDSMSEGMLLLDDGLNIKRTNKMASKILGIGEDEILNTNIKSLLIDIEFIKNTLKVEKAYHNLDCNFYVRNKRIKCSMNAFPVIINGRIQGNVITFKDEGYMHKVVNSIAGFSASYKFENIVTKNYNMKIKPKFNAINMYKRLLEIYS